MAKLGWCPVCQVRLRSVKRCCKLCGRALVFDREPGRSVLTDQNGPPRFAFPPRKHGPFAGIRDGVVLPHRSPHGVSREEWKGVLRADPCAYCGERSDLSRLPGHGGGSVDHIEPKSAGGASQSHKNMTGSCERCNSKKGSRSLLIYLLDWWPEYVLAYRRERGLLQAAA